MFSYVESKTNISIKLMVTSIVFTRKVWRVNVMIQQPETAGIVGQSPKYPNNPCSEVTPLLTSQDHPAKKSQQQNLNWDLLGIMGTIGIPPLIITGTSLLIRLPAFRVVQELQRQAALAICGFSYEILGFSYG